MFLTSLETLFEAFSSFFTSPSSWVSETGQLDQQYPMALSATMEMVHHLLCSIQ